MRTIRAGLHVFMLFTATLAGTAFGGAAAPSPIIVQGFQTPESVLYDQQNDVYLVSNINGNATAADDNGFISRVSPTGKVLNLKWIDGAAADVTLNGPKGLAVAGNTLYVSDITAVRMFDRKTGRPKGAIDIPGSTFLNDLASTPRGEIYVTDSGLKPDFSPSGTDAVYRIERNGTLTTVAKSPRLNHPNGVAVLPGGEIVVVTFSQPGEVYNVSASGQKQHVRTLPKGQLDGVVPLPAGALLISSWEASAVYRLDRNGKAVIVVPNVTSPADIGYDSRRRRLLIPLFMQNKVVIQPLR